MTPRTIEPIFVKFAKISWLLNGVWSLWHILFNNSFLPSGEPFGVVPEPENQIYVESIFINY